MSKICAELHLLFNKMEKFNFPFDENKIPKNGIYVLFEKGEVAHGTNRIVRVGTHTGKDQLRSRLFQHFLKKNKDRSIFRKNIGRALLNKNKDSFISQWELDLTTRKAKDANSGKVDSDKKDKTEDEVSAYIQENFSFVVFSVENKDKRLELESKIISTVSHCVECIPSKNWLGLYSPKEKIRKGGLWLVNELWKTPLSEKDLAEIMQERR